MERTAGWVARVPDSLWSRREVVAALRARDIASLLVLLRRYAGYSQNDLAGVTGIAQGRISEYMRRRRLPTLDTIERIADGVDMPPECRGLLGLAPERRCRGTCQDRVAAAHP
ncbi:helix-turn-helix protein [Saccharothrix carnea]|uniref:Helix-turn-helix protein n=1 Tax=Saccharothrix carnea TaxID=1280637 RepID=A0A2P8I2B4_SACCR|nr:helix-turn-helix transcriptional regulator [Saccharothrix carnea]PSL52602.1 helix-turn-helix protein [Saccharothrix carnea]